MMVAVARAVNYTKENTRWVSGKQRTNVCCSIATSPLPHPLSAFTLGGGGGGVETVVPDPIMLFHSAFTSG